MPVAAPRKNEYRGASCSTRRRLVVASGRGRLTKPPTIYRLVGHFRRICQMKKLTDTVFASLLVLAISIQGPAGQPSKAEERERAQKAAAAFQEIMGAPDQGIPQELLDRAQCV